MTPGRSRKRRQRQGSTKWGWIKSQASRRQKDQCKKVSAEKSDEQSPEGEDLLVEEEEQEYFLELLMRRASPERSPKSPPAKSVDCSARDGRRKNKEKKAREKNLKGRATGEVMKKEETGGPSQREREAGSLQPRPQPRGQGQRAGRGEPAREEPVSEAGSDLRREVFRIQGSGIFPRSS